MKTIKKGDRVIFKPEYRDEGDSDLIYIAQDDMEKSRVSVMPINTGLSFPPVTVVASYMIAKGG